MKRLFALLAMVSQASAGEMDFPNSGWDPKYLEIIMIGPEYLDRNLDVRIPPPYSPTSLETKRELIDLRIMQRDMRVPAENAWIFRESDPDLEPMELFEMHGLLPQRAEAPLVWAYLEGINGDLSYFIMREKFRFQRARPTSLDEGLTSIIPNPGHASYPSGHAAQSHAMAYGLSVINPGCVDEYFDLAAKIGRRREVAGVHFASDSRAGEQLSTTIVEMILLDQGFEPVIKSARDEIAARFPEGMPCPGN